METLTITATARTYPKLPYQKIKDDILGKSYMVSLAFVGATHAQRLNKTYRNKEYIPNVLSFPLDPSNGEIFITPTKAAIEASSFLMSKNGYIGFLFIHALLHLKGLDHGATMEKAEKKYCLKYGLR
jgi:probable rRNA maturation factor